MNRQAKRPTARPPARRNGVWVLALLLGLAAFVVWDQTRGAADEARPTVTRARSEAAAPASGKPAATDTEPAGDEEPAPPTRGVM